MIDILLSKEQNIILRKAVHIFLTLFHENKLLKVFSGTARYHENKESKTLFLMALFFRILLGLQQN